MVANRTFTRRQAIAIISYFDDIATITTRAVWKIDIVHDAPSYTHFDDIAHPMTARGAEKEPRRRTDSLASATLARSRPARAKTKLVRVKSLSPLTSW